MKDDPRACLPSATSLVPAIALRGVVKIYPGGIRALDGLDLTLAPGALMGLVGRNAAGKSTALRVAMGLLRADQGSALIHGHDYRSSSTWERARTAYVSQELRLPDAMSISDLASIASPVYPRWDADMVIDLCTRWELDRRRPLANFSGGQRRRAAILLALCARAEVLILDEPAAGLDPIARRELLDGLIEALSRQDGCSVLLSTHLISDLDRIADRISIIDSGRLLMDADRELLLQEFRQVQVVFPGTVPAGFSLPGMRLTIQGSVATAVGTASQATIDAVQAMSGVRVDSFPMSLEDIVVEVVSQAPFHRAPSSSAESP
jgi:ABC-2 type transport system ATP-binding protein